MPLEVTINNDNNNDFDDYDSSDKDSSLIWMWSIYAFLSAIIAISVGLVLTGFLYQYRFSLQRKKNTFNLYVVFLLIPNLLFAFFCTITCCVYIFSTSRTEGWCRFQSFYRLFDATSNAWLLSVVIQQVYEILIAVSKRRKSATQRSRSHNRVQSATSIISVDEDGENRLSATLSGRNLPRYYGFYPSRKTVLSQTAGVFAWALFWSLLPMLPSLEWVPVSVHGDNSTDVQDVIMCLPSINQESSMEVNDPMQSTNTTSGEVDAVTTMTSNRYVFFYIFYLPGVALFPILYFGYTLFKMWRKKLIQQVDEETKELAWYFVKLVLACAIIWIPAILLLFVLSSSSGGAGNRWMFWVGGLISHFMPLVTVSLTLSYNKDLREIIVKNIICRQPLPPRDSSSTDSNERGNTAVVLHPDDEQPSGSNTSTQPASYRDRLADALHDINNFIYDDEDDELRKQHEVDEEVRTCVTFDDMEDEANLSCLDSHSLGPSSSSSSSSSEDERQLTEVLAPRVRSPRTRSVSTGSFHQNPIERPPRTRSTSTGAFRYNPSEQNSTSSAPQNDEYPIRKLT